MKHILAAIDFSQLSTSVARQAASIAAKFSAKLTLVHIAAPDPGFIGYDPGPQVERDGRAGELRSEHRQLQELADLIQKDDVPAQALLVQGSTVEGIITQAKKLDANLIVIGSHGKGVLSSIILGSVSEGVLRQSSCPVLVIPAKAADSSSMAD